MSEAFAGLDVADKKTTLCVVTAKGDTLLEAEVETTPEKIDRALRPFRRLLDAVGMESGTKAAWLFKELQRRRYPILCLDARHTHGALKTKVNKTDKNDARGIADVVASGRYTLAHIRGDEAIRMRTILVLRKVMQRQAQAMDLALRGSMKVFGATSTRKGAVVTVAQATKSPDKKLSYLVQSANRAHAAVWNEAKALKELIDATAKADPVCKLLMTIPGVGPITALTYRSAVDDPSRFSSSRDVAAYFGLTPRTHQSGDYEVRGRISRRGDKMVRTALYEAAFVLLYRSKSQCRLRKWTKALAEKRGPRFASVACARRLAVIMHKMWVTGRPFDPLAA